ncbi:uncharacterized protein STEHIDRAFT_125327 [Stereum hirsutum FP-91666 SS1]|uniref:uncharacterized protein n=1 Tax=Stereum hirsutum (strain FP-91666) TaxID=721885 RepID=UPI00044499EE|nr:uncharacterized protein STEHIDRAFT_125327 [Stereum hirsutum FP-91666 SS1]EIM81040.1 hypothetical protein STEHIDRAFT_125327 [Stereum hirsutum FP-91666 SS1]
MVFSCHAADTAQSVANVTQDTKAKSPIGAGKRTKPPGGEGDGVAICTPSFLEDAKRTPALCALMPHELKKEPTTSPYYGHSFRLTAKSTGRMHGH